MQSPISLTFRRIDRSGALAERARKLGSHLTRFNERITRCHITILGPDSAGGDAGSAYWVKIDLTVPGAHIHADSLHVDGAGHDDIYLALRDAFNNAKRQLQDLPAVRRRKPDATGLAGAESG
jgi:putative sigma-54 modulation protein